MNEGLEKKLNLNKESEETREEIKKTWDKMVDLIRETDFISRFQHVIEGEKKFIVSSEDERFQILKLNEESESDMPALGRQLHEFNNNFFESEENDRPEDYEIALKRNLSDFYAILDENGKIISLLNTQLLKTNLPPENIEKLCLHIWYVSTKEENRQKGLGTELYRYAYDDFLEVARKERLPIYAILGETEETVEKYLNKVFGRKRLYFEHDDGTIEEIPYCSPPTLEGQEPTPEHFMIRLIDDKDEIPVSDFLKIIESLFQEYTLGDYAEIDSPKGKKMYEEQVAQIYQNLSESLLKAKNGKIFFLGPNERKKKKLELEKSGKKLIEKNG